MTDNRCNVAVFVVIYLLFRDIIVTLLVISND